jgi:hypothetical protein
MPKAVWKRTSAFSEFHFAHLQMSNPKKGLCWTILIQAAEQSFILRLGVRGQVFFALLNHAPAKIPKWRLRFR